MAEAWTAKFRRFDFRSRIGTEGEMSENAEGGYPRAKVSALPHFSGDGYGYGGGIILTLGSMAVPFGEGATADVAANECARRWNLYGEMLAVLKQAQEYIRNGVEMGFIRMPDSDVDDPAHKTLPAIDAAIAKAEGR